MQTEHLDIIPSIHLSVMPKEVIDCLQCQLPGKYLDCTLGGAGHSRLILQANPANLVSAGDRDPVAVERSSEVSEQFPNRFFPTKASFSELGVVFRNEKFDGILADLGISSDQLLTGRGFSFKDQDSLDMRMDPSAGLTAHDVVNTYSQKELMNILRVGGVTQSVMQISDAIIKARPIENAEQLARVINSAAKYNPKKKINPATLAFQAIRIEVNDELGEIKRLLEILPQIATAGCRLVIISFHSIEDQLVARAMRNWANPPQKPALWGGTGNAEQVKPLGQLVTKKALTPSEEEIAINPRSRSAKLRNFIFH